MKNNRNHFEKACEKLGIDPAILPDISMLTEEFAKPIIAFYKLQVIVKAWNDGWIANWDDYSQRKWFCWWDLDTPGFRFGDSLFDITNASATGGSRLAFASEKLADKAGEELDYLFADFFGAELPAETGA